MLDPAVNALLLGVFIVKQAVQARLAGILAAEIALPLGNGGGQDFFLIDQVAPGALHQAAYLQPTFHHVVFQPGHLLVVSGFAL